MVELQLSRLADNLDRPYRTYAYLDGGALAQADRFDEWFPARRSSIGGSSTTSRRGSARRRTTTTCCVFLDGDAFPIADLGAALDTLLAGRGLAAVRRTEIFGRSDPAPLLLRHDRGILARQRRHVGPRTPMAQR